MVEVFSFRNHNPNYCKNLGSKVDDIVHRPLCIIKLNLNVFSMRGISTIYRSLLKYESIEISYFAAGILANLMSDGPMSWYLTKLPRVSILMELETAILSWKQADKEMVAYRSFRPFLPLLRCFNTYQSQLWALWAIQHVLMSHGLYFCFSIIIFYYM